MTMKIDHQNPPPDSEGIRPSGTASAKTGKATDAAGAPGVHADTVDVAGAAQFQQLIARAVQAAMSGPASGVEAVAQAKALVAAGDVGRDHAALANAIIDHLIGSR
jgi:hypothetical protein